MSYVKYLEQFYKFVLPTMIIKIKYIPIQSTWRHFFWQMYPDGFFFFFFLKLPGRGCQDLYLIITKQGLQLRGPRPNYFATVACKILRVSAKHTLSSTLYSLQKENKTEQTKFMFELLTSFLLATSTEMLP